MLAICLMTMAVFTVKAQEGLKAEGHIGAMLGDASDYFGINIGGSVSYLFPVIDNLQLGGMAGLELYTGKDIPKTGTKLKGMTILPIAFSGQYDFDESFFAGADVGYGVSLSKDYKGGFFFQPKGGWQNDFIQVFAYFKTISNKLDSKVTPIYGKFNSVNTIGVGAAYKF